MKGLVDILSTFANLAGFLKEKSSDLAKIEASIAYLKVVQTARLAVLGLIGFAVLVMMMMTALIALHLFVFFMLPAGARFWSALALTAFDFAVVGTALYFIASEKMWMKLTRADERTEHTIEETAPELAHEPPRDIDEFPKAS